MNFTVNHLFFFSSALVLVLLLLLIWERVSVANALKHLPWRIHVNGTRGKSSVTNIFVLYCKRTPIMPAEK